MRFGRVSNAAGSDGDADAKRFHSLGDFATNYPGSGDRQQKAAEDFESRAHENTWSLGGTTTVPGGPAPGDASGLDEGFAEQDDLTLDLDEHYEILKHIGKEGKIGEGGMGEVYRARDTELGRDVAIKVLPASFSSDAMRVARFEQEAKTLAALNHSNIAHIYGLARGEGGSHEH